MKKVNNSQPFKTAQWRKPSFDEQADIFEALANISKSRISRHLL